MKLKITILSLLMIALLSSFFIMKKKPVKKDVWVCTCGQPGTPTKLSRTGTYVTLTWTAASGSVVNYKYVAYLNGGGTRMGNAGVSNQVTIQDNGTGGTIVITPVCQDLSGTFPYPQCDGTPKAGSFGI